MSRTHGAVAVLAALLLLAGVLCLHYANQESGEPTVTPLVGLLVVYLGTQFLPPVARRRRKR